MTKSSSQQIRLRRVRSTNDEDAVVRNRSACGKQLLLWGLCLLRTHLIINQPVVAYKQGSGYSRN